MSRGPLRPRCDAAIGVTSVARPTVLVTAQQLVPEAQQILRDAGADIEFMAEPITEATLVERLSASPVDAVVLRGSKPFSARVLAAAWFGVMLGGVCWLLWHAHEWSAPALLGGTMLVIAGLWVVGRLGDGRRAPAAMAVAG